MKVSAVFGLLLVALVCLTTADEMQSAGDSPVTSTSEGVLHHTVIYQSLPATPNYRSDSTFNPMGMEHVYMIANLFIDLIQREHFLPPSLNISIIDKVARQGEKPTQQLFIDHWQDIMMQHIGVLTLSIFGVVLAFLLPCIGLWFCCCRCCGRCGAYPDTHYDKKSDACKRATLGVFVSIFVMASVFAVVCALATNYYSYEGTKELSPRFDDALDDTGMYIEHTGSSINTLLVTNYKELEAVVGQILDESGVILKDNLAKVTQAIAINNLTDIVSGLGRIRGNLKDILTDTSILEERVAQLRDGLSESQIALGLALADCNSNSRCREFLREYDLEKDLALAEEFVSFEFKMPDLDSTLQEISQLIQNNIEEKVTRGKEQFDNIEQLIADSIDDIKPKVKQEMRKRGEELEYKNSDIQEALKSIDIGTLHKDAKLMKQGDIIFEVRFYIGLGLACLVALILLCFVFGLFYGMCGRRPGGYYEDECCNKGTGANCLITGVYFFFLFSFVVILGITAHFLLGTTAEKVICETAGNPRESDIFKQLDDVYFKPLLRDMMTNGGIEKNNYSSIDLLERCHANMTMFKILDLEKVYNLDQITNWRESYGIGEYIENMKNKVKLDDLQSIRLLSTETERYLMDLAESKISDMDFSKFTSLLEDEITKIDLRGFIDKLRQLKEVWKEVGSTKLFTQIENQALWLEGMNKVAMDLKVTLRHLKASVVDLEKNMKFNHSSLREAITALITQANSATKYLQTQGPTLITELSEQFSGEILDLVDEYSDRVHNKILHEVGYCAPISNSINATIVGICNQVVDPMNGFWAALGLCMFLYLPCVVLSVSLVSLYRKSEPYPGPLVESQPLDHTHEQPPKSKRKGHARNPSSFLPEYTHSRPTPNSQQRYRDIAPRNYGGGNDEVQPPRYSSHPNLPPEAIPPSSDYERPPPYYYPGPPNN